MHCVDVDLTYVSRIRSYSSLKHLVFIFEEGVGFPSVSVYCKKKKLHTCADCHTIAFYSHDFYNIKIEKKEYLNNLY